MRRHVFALPFAVGCYLPEYPKDSAIESSDSAVADDSGVPPDPAVACVADHPTQGTDDLVSDAPVRGELETTAEDVRAECAAQGDDCSRDVFISHDAATCIGPHFGVVPGEDGRIYAALNYSPSAGAVVWVVENHQGVRGEDPPENWGQGVHLDAVTGAVAYGPYEWRLRAD